MVKRKFGCEVNKPSKKIKNVESATDNNVESVQPQNEENCGKTSISQHNNDGFDIKYFRKELAVKQGQTIALTQFLQVCLDPDSPADYLLEYLKSGGNSHEILRQINQESKKNLTLATPVFHIFHLIILKVQSSLPHMITITEEACRYFLNNFMSTVEIMVSESSGPRHRKIVLKLLTTIVTLNPDLGVEVLNQAPLTPKHLQHIVEKPNFKEKDNVRTAFVHFMTSFLVDGHLPLIKALLEKQGLLALIIPGLVSDEPEAVLIFLNILKKNVIETSLISKSLKLKTFSHQVLQNMFKIFSWRGPPELPVDIKNKSQPEIMSLLTDIVLILFTSHKLGLYFVDNSLGTADGNKNQSLYKALLMLKRPWENEHSCEVILNIVYKCPDLHRAIISVIEQSFVPQHSPIWVNATNFTIDLINKLKPEDIVPKMTNLNSVQVSNFIRFITLPVPLLKLIHINLGKDHITSVYCVKVLVKMLQSLRRYIQILEMEESSNIVDLKNKLDYFFPKHLPTPATIVSLVYNVINGKTDNDNTKGYKLPIITETDALTLLIDLLLLYNDIHPTYFETLQGNIDLTQILDFSSTLTNGHISLLKFKIVSLWLTLDPCVISVKNPMFKVLFLIMLDVYMNDDDDTWIEAKDTLHVFFKNTSIFESDEDEIHIILHTLRNSKISPPGIIGDIIEYVLENIKTLNEYIRNQLIHFEISSEDSELSLNKLFDDLMENRSSENSVFLENKIPSPFLVGSVQYSQMNKHVKKSLNNFLSLYIANLLHSNYSPELTEILIGDSKLDVRNYVASWIGKPISLPDTITGKDDILKYISKSIIENEDISFKDVMPFVDETAEESDIIIDNVSYKVNLNKNVDSSALLIWSKYLIFCTVRLTNLDKLNERQQKKINNYFQSIIVIGKKHHMVEICRSIILTLFKNPHFLNIYRPLDTLKNESKLLATEFLLKVITENKEIINYLNKKYKALKTYQQKNYDQIVDAFIKINKKKKFNSTHTIKVVEVVGLSKEDDLKIFNLIFATNKESYSNDNKEPSLVLEMLRYLIEKYMNSATLELHARLLNNTMVLYTELLSNMDVNLNLTNLEITLAKYFDNKPYQSSLVLEDHFKKFFQINVRKSATNFACVLLTHNSKFCKLFHEQISRSEILIQRELILPLGTALINHKQYLLQNKELLPTIYNEYKSNILKMLEKPHKAGQIYFTCWKFIKKLVLECMGLQECEKVFNKSYKFEKIESNHIDIFNNIFLRLMCNKEIFKKDHLIHYFLSMVHLMTAALKDMNTASIHSIVKCVHNAVEVYANMYKLEAEHKEEFKKIIESSIWQNFCKSVLKDSLKRRTVEVENTLGPKLLGLLTNLVKLFYPENHEDVVTLFDMITSHSEFLNVMLSYQSSHIKSRLIELLSSLMSRNKSVMKSQQIPVYLSAYHATRRPCDRLIVSILHFYETNGLPVNEYKPYVWGDSAANHYAVRKTRSASLWAHPTANQVLNLFDKDIIERTVRNFPVTQKLKYDYQLPSIIDANEVADSLRSVINEMIEKGAFRPNTVKDIEGEVKNFIFKAQYESALTEMEHVDLATTSHLDSDDNIYDPAFLLPLLSHLLVPGSVASCFKLLRTGLLSVPVMALSSQCPMMRAAAYHVLHRFSMLLETETRHKSDKIFLTDFINTLRHSIGKAINNADTTVDSMNNLKNPKLPAINALYFARALMVSTAPFDPLYKPVNSFLRAKEYVDMTLVPDFLSLFHDSDVESIDRRIWILDIIRDGTKTMADINVVFRTMCLKMIMDFYSSVLSDRKVKESILSVLSSIVSIPRAFEILVEGYGLISWIHLVVRQINDRALLKPVFGLIKNMMYSMIVGSFARNIAAKNGKVNDFIELRVNKDIEQELLVVVYDLLKHVNSLRLEDILEYVKIYGLFTKRAIKSLAKKQMLRLVNKKCVFYKDREVINLLNKALLVNDPLVLKSRNLDDCFDCASTNLLLHELAICVRTYIV